MNFEIIDFNVNNGEFVDCRCQSNLLELEKAVTSQASHQEQSSVSSQTFAGLIA